MNARYMNEADRVRAALAVIPAEDYATWVEMAFAVKSGLGDAGFAIWDEWSRSARNYSEHVAQRTWRSARVDGGRTLASLFWLAREHGFELKRAQPGGAGRAPAAPQTAGTPEVSGQSGQARAASARMRARHAVVAREASSIWQWARPVGPDHPYLQRKQVVAVPTLRELEAEELRVLLGYTPRSAGESLTGRVLVAPVHRDDVLSTLELIDADGRKSALAGGRKAGGCWRVAPDELRTCSPQQVVVAEGVATALSAWQATGWLCVAALSAGNLRRTTAMFRARYPRATLLVLAEAGAGHDAALRAAQENSAVLVAPCFAPAARIAGKAPTDFNDMAVLSGLPAVAELLRQAVHRARLQFPGVTAGLGQPDRTARTADRVKEDRTMAREDGQTADPVGQTGSRPTLRRRAGTGQVPATQAPDTGAAAAAVHAKESVSPPHADGQALADTVPAVAGRHEVGDPLYSLDAIPPEIRALAQHRFGAQVRMATPRVNGGPYRGEVYSTEHYLIQEVSTRSVVFHAKGDMEYISGRLRWMEENQRINGTDVQIAYDGAQPKLYPWDRARDQLERTVASLKKSAREMGLGADFESTLEQLQTASWARVREARAAALARAHERVREEPGDALER